MIWKILPVLAVILVEHRNVSRRVSLLSTVPGFDICDRICRFLPLFYCWALTEAVTGFPLKFARGFISCFKICMIWKSICSKWLIIQTVPFLLNTESCKWRGNYFFSLKGIFSSGNKGKSGGSRKAVSIPKPSLDWMFTPQCEFIGFKIPGSSSDQKWIEGREKSRLYFCPPVWIKAVLENSLKNRWHVFFKK